MYTIKQDENADPKQIVLWWDYGVPNTPNKLIYKLQDTPENLERLKSIKNILTQRG